MKQKLRVKNSIKGWYNARAKWINKWIFVAIVCGELSTSSSPEELNLS